MLKYIIKNSIIIILLILPTMNFGSDSFTIVCTGSVHGEVDPCG